MFLLCQAAADKLCLLNVILHGPFGYPVGWVVEGEVRMPRRRNGLVVGKDFKPPTGGDHEDFCYLVVDISDGELVSVRLAKSQIDKAVLGDRVEFVQPRRYGKPVRWLRRI